MKTGIKLYNSISAYILSIAFSLRIAFLLCGVSFFDKRNDFLSGMEDRTGDTYDRKDKKGKGEQAGEDNNQDDESGNDDDSNDDKGGKKEGEETEGAEEVIYKVGDKELSEAEFKELVEDASKHYEDDITKYPEKTMMKLLEDRINMKKGSSALNDKNQRVSQKERDLDKEKAMLTAAKADFAKQETALNEEKTKLEREISEYNERIKANKKLLEKDPEEEETDTKKNRLIMKQGLAEQENLSLENDIKSKRLNIQKIDNQYSVNYTLSLIDELLIGIPELRTKDHPLDILEAVGNKIIASDSEDAIKAFIVTDLVNGFSQAFGNNKNSKIGIIDYYNFNSNKYLPSLTAAAQTDKGKDKDKGKKEEKGEKKKKYVEFKAGNARKVIQELVKKHKLSPGSSSGGGAGDQKSSGSKTREDIATGIKSRFGI